MRKIVGTLLGILCAVGARGQTLAVHNMASFTITACDFEVANSTACGWGIPNCEIPPGFDMVIGPLQDPVYLLAAAGSFYSAIGICDAWNPSTGQSCGYESWGVPGSWAPIAPGYMPQLAWSQGSVDVYVTDNPNAGTGPASGAKVNMAGCITINNTSDHTVYGFPQEQIVTSSGVQNNPIGCGPGQYMEIPPGQSLKICDQDLQMNYSDIQNGGSASLQFVQVNMGGGVVDCNTQGPHLTAGDCVSLCNGDGSPYNPSGLSSSNVIASAPELPVSTNGVPGNGPSGSGSITIPDSNSGVVFNTNGMSDILYSSTNASAVAQTGFDALYDVANKQLIELQQMDNNQMAEAQSMQSNATANANAILTGVTNAVGGLRYTMTGLSNIIAQWGSASGSNGPVIWTEPTAMSNQLGAIAASTALIVTNEAALISNNLVHSAYLADFSNALVQLNTNIQNTDSNAAYLAAISNNTAQPNRYTNVEFGSVFPTNAADIGTMGSNQAANVADSLQSLGNTLTGTADSINGNGPGGDGSIFTVQAEVPGPAGGTLTYTVDMNPMDYPAIVDLASFVRKVITWLVGIGFLLKMVGDVSQAVGQMMSTAQGQVPRVTVLGNTVGWAVAGVYLVGIIGAMVGLPLFIVTYLTSNGFGPTLWAQIQTNPFSSSGYGASMVGALWLADKFAPLYFVVATTLYYAAFRLTLVRLVTLVAAVVRAFMA